MAGKNSPQLSVPPEFLPHRSQAGSHRRGYKTLWFGGDGSGKSYAVSHAPGKPGERIIIECGEGGIESYLDPAEKDYTFTVTDVDTFNEIIDWCYRNAEKIRSVIIDPLNLQWEATMEHWEEKLGHSIEVQDWRKVKAAHKTNLRRLTRAPFNVAMTAHLKDIEIKRQAGGPGEQGPLIVKSQVAPQVEKNVPYVVDFAFYCQKSLDKDNLPTGWHEVVLTKCRRPRAIPPSDLHVGMRWRFDSKEMPPPNPWGTIIDPIAEVWKDGAVDYLGADPQEVRQVLADLELTAQDADLGRILRIIGQQTDLMEYKQVWEKHILPYLPGLSPEHIKKIEEQHEAKKKELTGD